MLGSLADLNLRREPISNEGNLTGKSCYGNCLFWKNGPKWLNLKSFNLLESRLLRGREWSSLLVHDLSHSFFPHFTFFYPLYFFLPSILFLVHIFPPFFLVFSLFSFLLFFSLVPPYSLLLPLPLLCTAKAFLYCLPWYFYWFTP